MHWLIIKYSVLAHCCFLIDIPLTKSPCYVYTLNDEYVPQILTLIVRNIH